MAQSVAFKNEPLCHVIQIRYLNGSLNYDSMCLQEFTLNTSEYRRRTPKPMDKYDAPSFLRHLDEIVERGSVHDKFIKPVIGHVGSEVHVRSAPDAKTCQLGLTEIPVYCIGLIPYPRLFSEE